MLTRPVRGQFFKFSIFIIITSLFFEVANAQNNQQILEENKKEVRVINNFLLERTITHQIKVEDSLVARFPRFREVVGGTIGYTYKDNEGRIRKFILMTHFGDINGYHVHYFNATGELIYSYIYSGAFGGTTFGNRYMSNGKQLFCEMYSLDESNDEEWKPVTYSDGEICLTLEDSFDNILNASSVVTFNNSYYGHYGQTGDIKSYKVRFVSPSVGDKTVINSHGVGIRENSDINSAIIYRPRFGEIVEIIEKDKESNIEPYGKHYWYKISVMEKTGYIFGAFLEPVETVVKHDQEPITAESPDLRKQSY